MSWAWAKSLDVYLCRGVVWSRVPGVGVLSLRLPASLPLATQLQRVSEQLAPHLKKPTALNLSLGARWCPPVCFDVPRGLRWSEQQWMGQKAATQLWGMKPTALDDLSCVLSRATPGLAAALPRVTLDVLQGWAATQQVALHSITPLWSLLSGCQIRNLSPSGKFLLSEPDGSLMQLQGHPGGCRSIFLDAPSEKSDEMAVVELKWNDALATSAQTKARRWSWRTCFQKLTP